MLTKIVNGKSIQLSTAEELNMRAEWYYGSFKTTKRTELQTIIAATPTYDQIMDAFIKDDLVLYDQLRQKRFTKEEERKTKEAEIANWKLQKSQVIQNYKDGKIIE